MKTLNLLLLLLFVSWTTIQKGLYYQHISTNLPQNIYLLKVDPKLFLIVSHKAHDKAIGKATVLQQVQQKHALAGVNGGFFKANGMAAGVLKIENTWYTAPSKLRAAIGWNTRKPTPIIDRLKTQFEMRIDNKTHMFIHLFPEQTKKGLWETLDYIVGGAPLLIYEGQEITDFSPEKTLETFLTKRHARTALGILPTKEWLFVVVDGKQKEYSLGMTMPELVSFMKEQGCIAAINLDGGGSSTMVIDDKVINHPFQAEDDEDKTYNLREVSDTILILPKEKSLSTLFKWLELNWL